jgi:hypothetical protein
MSTSADIPPFLYPIVQGIVDALRIPRMCSAVWYRGTC